MLTEKNTFITLATSSINLILSKQIPQRSQINVANFSKLILLTKYSHLFYIPSLSPPIPTLIFILHVGLKTQFWEFPDLGKDNYMLWSPLLWTTMLDYYSWLVGWTWKDPHRLVYWLCGWQPICFLETMGTLGLWYYQRLNLLTNSYNVNSIEKK